jgi:hypothetical protein
MAELNAEMIPYLRELDDEEEAEAEATTALSKLDQRRLRRPSTA